MPPQLAATLKGFLLDLIHDDAKALVKFSDTPTNQPHKGLAFTLSVMNYATQMLRNYPIWNTVCSAAYLKSHLRWDPFL